MFPKNTWRALLLTVVSASSALAADAPGQAIPATAGAALETELVASFGEAQRERIHRGIAQTAALWKRTDGDEKAWAAFVRENFAGTPTALDALFNRYQHNLEMIWGHTQEIRRELNSPADLDTGPVAPFDETFAAWDPSAHVLDDLFDNKLAFIALLNFPLTSLE